MVLDGARALFMESKEPNTKEGRRRERKPFDVAQGREFVERRTPPLFPVPSCSLPFGEKVIAAPSPHG